MSNKIQNALAPNQPSGQSAEKQQQAGGGIVAVMNSLLDSEQYRKRFNELLGARTPQFISSLVSLVKADNNLKKVFLEAPVTIIQSALKAATFDLPIDPNLGYAYLVPFNNTYIGNDGKKKKRMEATFVMGYKGMLQLALRTGVYKTINVVDVRQGELKSYNRLTEEVSIDFIDNDVEREKLPIVGWCGFYRLINGTEKTIYMTLDQIKSHEQKHRKGEYMGKGWRENFDEMAAKTVYRRLIGKFGLMSIDYQRADRNTIAAAEAISSGKFDDEDLIEDTEIPEEYHEPESNYTVDPETGEVIKSNE